MKFTAKVFAVSAFLLLLTGFTSSTTPAKAATFSGAVLSEQETLDEQAVLNEQATLTPPRLRQPFPSAFKAPRKDYPPRVPARPAPRKLPSKPKASHENRGGGGKFFGVPRVPG